MARRHGAEVIADKLREGLDRWPDRLGWQERDAIGIVIHAFEQIAAEDLSGNGEVTEYAEPELRGDLGGPVPTNELLGHLHERTGRFPADNEVGRREP